MKTQAKDNVKNRWLKWLPIFLVKKYSNLRPLQSQFGNGTQTDPYQIATVENLLWLSDNDVVWNKHFVQTKTIDCRLMKEFTPIGRNVPFTGTYDGNCFGLTNFNRKIGV